MIWLKKQLCPIGFWACKKIFWRLLFDNAPFIHQGDPMRHTFGKIQLMRHANHAHPLIGKRDHGVQNFFDLLF